MSSVSFQQTESHFMQSNKSHFTHFRPQLTLLIGLFHDPSMAKWVDSRLSETRRLECEMNLRLHQTQSNLIQSGKSHFTTHPTHFIRRSIP